MVILPLSFMAAESALDAKVYLVISTVGHFSLFPLLFEPAEFPIKVRVLLTALLIPTSMTNTNANAKCQMPNANANANA